MARRLPRLEEACQAAAKAAGETVVSERSGLQKSSKRFRPSRIQWRDDATVVPNPYLEDEKYSLDECKERGKTYAAPLYVEAEFMNHLTGEIKTQTVFMGDFP